MENYGFNNEELHLDLRPRRKKRFHNKSKTKIYLLTWNVNGRGAPDDLGSAFPPGADIYAIGLQEAGSFDWVASLDTLMRQHDVVRIKMRRMQGIITLVYVKRKWLHFLCHIESELTRTGLSGMWGNKGGCSIRFDILGISLIVVNSHLAAHMEKVKERVEDVASIMENQKFKDKDVDNILDHDYVFWMGDLNFRVDDITYEDAVELVNNKNYKTLLQKDQLKSVMKDELAFCGFHENDIKFPPTYKFDVGTDVLDTSPKKRIPAYCDRVLYHYHDTTYSKTDTLRATCLEYRAHHTFICSDHKPVSCFVELNALHAPPSNPVTFLPSKKAATTKKSFIIKFHFKKDMKPASGDWIGLYKADFPHFEEFISYQWVTTSHADKFSHSSSVTFPADIFKKLGEATCFVTCYISKQLHFSGISEPFELVH